MKVNMSATKLHKIIHFKGRESSKKYGATLQDYYGPKKTFRRELGQQPINPVCACPQLNS